MRVTFFFALVCLLIHEAKAQSWTNLGPFGVASFGAPFVLGSGRVFAVDFHPTNQNVVYTGGYGGAWKSIDGGNSFALMNTDQISPVSTVGAMAADPSDTNYIYISTGTPLHHFGSNLADGMSNTMAIHTGGIYRSSDGGATWNAINQGLTTLIQSKAYINSLVICPYDPNTLFALTSKGLYKTTNARITSPGSVAWVKINQPNIPSTSTPDDKLYWMMYEPGATSSTYTVYLSNETGIRYTNDFVNWTWITGSGAGQINIFSEPEYNGTIAAMSEAVVYTIDIHPTVPSIKYICVFAKKLQFIYKYNGTSWDKKTVYTNASTDQSAAIHNIVIDRNTTNRVFLGGGNILYYDDLTTSVKNISGSYNSNYSHADHRFFKINPVGGNRYLYTCNDGFLTKVDLQASLANASTCVVQNTNANLCTAWLCNVSVHPDDASRYSVGLPDNGNQYVNHGTVYKLDNGDGFVSYTGEKALLTNNNHGGNDSYFVRAIATDGSINTDTYSSTFLPSLPNGEEQRTMTNRNVFQAFESPGSIIVSHHNLYYYEFNSGTGNFIYKRPLTFFSSSFGTPVVSGLSIYPLNRNIAYMTRTGDYCNTGCSEVYKTTNLTATTPTWTQLTSAPSMPWGNIRDVEVSPLDPNTVFIACMDPYEVHKVKVSYDGGTTWNEYNNTSTIPTYQIYEIAHEPGTPGRLYATTAVGVYYTDASLSGWLPYNTGYPIGVVSHSLFINEKENKITTGTLGRGVWQGYLYCGPSTALNLSGAVTTSVAKETRGTITSTSTLSNGTGAVNVTYRAGSTVTLKPGFKASNNYFRAYILPCGGSVIAPPSVNGNRNAVSETEDAYEEEEEGEDEEQERLGIDLYPNPTVDIVELKLEDPEEWKNVQLTCYTTDGKQVTVSVEKVSERLYRMDFSGNPPGVYLLCMVSGEKRVVKRLIVVAGTTQMKKNISGNKGKE